MIPATIPRWSRFVTFISVLIPASSFCSCALPLVNYFTLPLRAECGLNIECMRKTFILDYTYQGYRPEVKEQVSEMAVNGSGIRDQYYGQFSKMKQKSYSSDKVQVSKRNTK